MKTSASRANVRSAIVVAVLVGGIWTLSGCRNNDIPQAKIEPGPTPAQLVIVTPHNQTIRRAFERGFSDWHVAEFGQPVDIRWVAMGTPQCLRYIEDAATNDEIAQRGLAPDLMFGGGVTEHRTLIERGFARKLTKPIPETATIPATLAGAPLVDEAGYWHATALSGFGILYHEEACALRGIPAPKTWEALADPALYGWVAIADPTQSGSNRFCLDLILQRHGWEKGWGVIIRVAANSRALLPGSTAVLENVSSGLCLAGLSVNFAAQQAAAGRRDGVLAYTSPTGASAITPDVSTITSYASSNRIAERFLRFCLSEMGQELWSVGSVPATEGPENAVRSNRETLFRYPVVPAMYEKFAGRLAVADNPFQQTTDFKIDMNLEQNQARIIGPLLLAACGESDNHILLQRAWKAVIDAGLPADALAELTSPPFDQATAFELGRKYEATDESYALAVDWSAAFRAKYEKVIQMTTGAP
ncbi:MAG: extracellular solute-binding protein [bacterium]|nr:extracellular solute-binding protein [bacterium]